MFFVLCPLSFVLLLLLVLCPLSSCYYSYSVLCPLVTSRLFLYPLVATRTLSSVFLPVPILLLLQVDTLSSILLLLLVLYPLSSCYFSLSLAVPTITLLTMSLCYHSLSTSHTISTSHLLGVGDGSADLQDDQEGVYGSMSIDYRLSIQRC